MDYMPILKTIILIELFLVGAGILILALLRLHEHHQEDKQ